MSESLQSPGLQHTRLPCLSPSPRACSNSYPLTWWCLPTISSSIIPFSCCLQSFPASGSFLMSQLFASDGQSIGASASASVLPMKTQGWFHLGLTGLILQSERLSRVFSSTTVGKHLFFSIQPSLWSNSHILILGSNPQMVYISGFGVLNFLQYLNPTRPFKVCFVFSLFDILDKKSWLSEQK